MGCVTALSHVTVSDQLCLDGYSMRSQSGAKDVMLDAEGTVLHTPVLQDSLGALL